MAVEINSVDWWVSRLLRKLGERRERYDTLNKWAVGDHPLPEGDKRYVKALADLQKKAKTNYVGLALKATTQRMRLRTFKFGGEVDSDAMRIWKANSMDMQASMAIADAGKLSDSYTLVSPAEEDTDGLPIITVEDPRNCIVESDPRRPLNALAGLKAYSNDIIGRTVIVLWLPDKVYVYHGPLLSEEFDHSRISSRVYTSGVEAAGLELIEEYDNTLGSIPLVRGVWQPDTGLAECEDGGFEVQDRINHTILARLIISKSQAYRQRFVSGAKIPKGPDGKPLGKPPWDPGADMVWVAEDKDARIADLDQADITQVLEAIRDDIGDFAALTQTPVTYLTNRMINVSGDAMQAAQHSHVAKIRRRQEAMGWYFEQIIKLCFRYQNDARWQDVEAEVQWQDPEVHTLAEFAELAVKYATTEIPLELIMERLGFSPEEIKRAVEIAEQRRQEEHQREVEVKEAGVPDFPARPPAAK